MVTSNKNRTIDIAIFSLTAILVCNLNAVSTSLFGLKQIFSPLILLLCFFIILQTKGQKERDWSIVAFISFYLLHYSVGTVVRLFHKDDFYYVVPLKEVFFQCVTSLVIIYAFYKGTIHYIRQDKFDRLLNFLLVSFSFTVIMILLCFFLGWNIVKGIAVEDRAGGFFANPNEAGTAANIGLSLLMVKLMTNGNSNFLKFLLLPLFVLASFVSFSKMSMLITLGLLIYFFFFSTYKINKINKKSRVYIIGLLLIIILLILSLYANFDYLLTYLSPEQGRRIKGLLLLIVEREVNSNTTSERDIIVYIALELIQRHPFLGYGFGYFQQGLDSSDHGVHNTHLQIIGETGIPIYLFYLSCFGILWIKALISKNQAITYLIFAGSFIFLANNLASHNDLYNRSMNAFMGIVCAMATFYRASYKT